MTGFDSKRRIALDRLDDDDIQVYAQSNLKGESMTNDEALTLEALKYAASMGHGRMVREMKIAPFTIKEAQAQPVQEPVGFIESKADNECADAYADGWNACVHAHKDTTPPKRPWVGLTDDEIIKTFNAVCNGKPFEIARILELHRAIEAKLKERNHG